MEKIKTIMVEAVKVTDRLPKKLMTVPVLIDNRLPLVIMYVGISDKDEWRYLGTQEPVKPGIVTHWFDYKYQPEPEEGNNMLSGIELIANERREQIEKHRITLEKDIELNDHEQLTVAAAHLISVGWNEGIDSDVFPDGWDHDACMHMFGKPYKERLIIAGALIAAEIDRIQAEY